MPLVTVKEPYTRSTFNSPDFARTFVAHIKARMGENWVIPTPPVMAGEDFGEFLRADEDNIQSLIFWVGGTPATDLAAARRGEKTIPSLHSPFWAPEAEKVIASAAEAFTLTAQRLMTKP